MVSSFPAGVKNRIDRATWPAFGLGRITQPAEISALKQWCRESITGNYVVEAVKQTIGNRRHTIATFVRVQDEADALIFKLKWGAYE